MSVTVGQILDILNQIAPPELKEDYDNVGLLAGRPDRPVERIMVGLDLTEGLVREAAEWGAQLIVTHHPIFFRGRKNIREDDAEGAAVCALIRENMSLIAAHTNFDNAPCGVNDALAQALGLEDVCVMEHGMRMGMLPEAMSPERFCDWTEEKLACRARMYVLSPETLIERVAVCGGAGGDFWTQAARAGAQAFVTGEIRHHDALAGTATGLCMVEAGHYETEHIAIKLLADGLQERINKLQYNVTVTTSAYAPFWRFGK